MNPQLAMIKRKGVNHEKLEALETLETIGNLILRERCK